MLLTQKSNHWTRAPPSPNPSHTPPETTNLKLLWFLLLDALLVTLWQQLPPLGWGGLHHLLLSFCLDLTWPGACRDDFICRGENHYKGDYFPFYQKAFLLSGFYRRQNVIHETLKNINLWRVSRKGHKKERGKIKTRKEKINKEKNWEYDKKIKQK